MAGAYWEEGKSPGLIAVRYPQLQRKSGQLVVLPGSNFKGSTTKTSCFAFAFSGCTKAYSLPHLKQLIFRSEVELELDIVALRMYFSEPRLTRRGKREKTFYLWSLRVNLA
jgi:hypothetical protein